MGTKIGWSTGMWGKKQVRGSMKYFLYISDSKVDLLYAQIPGGIQEKIAAEMKLDLKLLSVSLKEKQSEATRYSKLNLVATYIERHQDIGTVDQPASYIKDVLSMRWGPYDSAPGLVFFGGSTKTSTIGLGGSMHHVVGNVRGTSNAESFSATPIILGEILRGLEPEDAQKPASSNELAFAGARIDPLDSQDWTKAALLGVKLTTEAMRGPLQRLEFLAKRLLEGQITASRDSRAHVLLGSPVYVALVD